MKDFTLCWMEPKGEKDKGCNYPKKNSEKIRMSLICQIHEKQKNSYHTTHDGKEKVEGGTVRFADMLHDHVLAAAHRTPRNGLVTLLEISGLNGFCTFVILFLDKHNGTRKITTYNRFVCTLVITAASNSLLQQPCFEGLSFHNITANQFLRRIHINQTVYSNLNFTLQVSLSEESPAKARNSPGSAFQSSEASSQKLRARRSVVRVTVLVSPGFRETR